MTAGERIPEAALSDTRKLIVSKCGIEIPALASIQG